MIGQRDDQTTGCRTGQGVGELFMEAALLEGPRGHAARPHILADLGDDLHDERTTGAWRGERCRSTEKTKGDAGFAEDSQKVLHIARSRM